MIRYETNSAGITNVRLLAGITLAYENTYTLNVSGPTLIHFDYPRVSQVRFITPPEARFAMDNVEVTVPPSGPPRPIQLAISSDAGFKPLVIR